MDNKDTLMTIILIVDENGLNAYVWAVFLFND